MEKASFQLNTVLLCEKTYKHIEIITRSRSNYKTINFVHQQDQNNQETEHSIQQSVICTISIYQVYRG